MDKVSLALSALDNLYEMARLNCNTNDSINFAYENYINVQIVLKNGTNDRTVKEKTLQEEIDSKIPTLSNYMSFAKGAGAFFTFHIDIEGKGYDCNNEKDFIEQYGKVNEHLLHDYVVLDKKESVFSNSQGQTIWITTEPLSKYKKKNPNVTALGVFNEIVNQLPLNEDNVKRIEFIKNVLLKESER